MYELPGVYEHIGKFSEPKDVFDYFLSFGCDGQYYFRGINNQIQKFPSIMRVENKHGKDKIDLSSQEVRLLNGFFGYGSSFVSGINDPIDCIAYSQHYGLPTRLVDWTRNPFVALFFAIYYAGIDKSSSVLIVETKNIIKIDTTSFLMSHPELKFKNGDPVYSFINLCEQIKENKFFDIYERRLLEEETDEGTKSYLLRDMKRKIMSNEMIFFDSRYTNKRLASQDGVFYIPKVLSANNIKLEYKKSKVKEVKIDPEFNKNLLTLLENIGISKCKLFFDPVSISEYVKEMVIDLNRDI